jgi:maltose alpha-D-glucosyltransferase/alpha-amylase
MASPERGRAAAGTPEADSAILQIDSWERPFSPKVREVLRSLLPDFLAARRWFRSKARTIRQTHIEDVLKAGNAWILIMEVSYADDGLERYLLPLAIARKSHAPPECREILAKLAGVDGEAGVLYGALWDADFRALLLRAIASNATIRGSAGEFVARSTSAFESEITQELSSSLSHAEQSNSSIIYSDRYILKLFRKLESGVDPDAEIGIFLTARGFRHTPAVLGTLEYRTEGEVFPAGVLQRYVSNQGDAWKFTLESLKGFFGRATGGRRDRYAPVLKNSHPLDLAEQALPEEMRELLGTFADKIRLLGKRTAEMHVALYDPHAGPDFAPEPFTREAAAKAYRDMLAQADLAFELVRRKEAELLGDVAASAREFLASQYRVTERFARFRDFPMSLVRIRHHGDFHLGQVLYTGDDFVMIDFEGEPSRPLSDRRQKALAPRDVAGMMRSFHYAAYVALFHELADSGSQSTLLPAFESWATYWSTWISALYLTAYFNTVGEGPIAGSSQEERRVLLDAFLLEKALYEVAYELNNRPDWLRIPLRGVLSLIGEE